MLGGAVAASAVAWKINKVLDGIKQIKEDINRLTTSDFKSAMELFKEILISLAHDIDPDLDDVKEVYRKAIDGYTKLEESKIMWKLELIKIQMFCVMYINCYDQKSCSILPFDKVSENHRNKIRDIFNEKLKELDRLAEVNHLEDYAESSFTAKGKLTYQKKMDAIDHIKKTSYSNVIIKDTIYPVNDFDVKIWSLKGFMVPEGENDALFSSLNIIKPILVTHADEVTMQASIYKDKGKTWFLKVHLPSEEDYEDLTVFCQYQEEDKEPVIYLPCKIDNKSWKVDTSFVSNQDGVISFFVCKPGKHEISLPLAVEKVQTSETFDPLVSFGKAEFHLLKNGFALGKSILETKSYSVMTVIGFMNMSNSTVQVSPPALVSGCTSTSYPWPTELPPLKAVNMVARKRNFSTRGSVGATIFKLSPLIQILFYWSTPFDHNLFENCFGIGFYASDSTDSIDNSKSLLETIRSLPGKEPNGIKFELHQAKDGPVCIDLTNNWMLSVKMTTDHKAAIDIILYNV